jgi:hypothetical protein
VDQKQFFMAKTIKSRVEYQVTELVNNLNEAATATSEQKRDFFTTRALYNAKRLSTFVTKAKIGAMALVLSMSFMACAGSSEQSTKDSVASDVVVDTVANAPVDTVAAPAEGGSGNAESLQPIK